METQRAASLERRFADGDDRAMNEIYDRFSARMAGLAYRVLRDRDLAAEAVQQALVRAWRASGSYDPRRPLEPWLFAITRRTALDIHRLYRHGDRVVPLESVHLDTLHSLHDGHDQTLTSWRVHTAIGRLSSSDQAVVRLVFLHDLTHREVAEQLGIPIGTVKSRMFRAQRKLVDLLSDLRSTQERLPAAVA